MKLILKMGKGLSIILAVVCLYGFIFGQSTVFANDRYEKRFDRIDEALREGQISLKSAVLKKAKILYSPNRAPLEGEEIGDETPRLELFEDVRRAFEDLTVRQKNALRFLSPDLARVIDEEESGGQPQKAPVSQRLPTTFDRISRAQDSKDISLKDAVLLKARLLFTPQTIETNHPFSVQAGEVPVQEPCLTEFFVDVHRVFDKLTDEEISFLGSLSPDLKVIMTVREQERSGTIDHSKPSALPSYPDLDKQEEGRSCIVHYTLAGANAVPNKTYAELVRLYMDMAIKKLTKDFPTAYAEGYADFKGKMHVYVIDMSDNGTQVPVSNVSGKKWSCYIRINNAFDTRYGNTWQVKLKGVCFHEYFHGIQCAYNGWADGWFKEATSVWAEDYYGKDWVHVGGWYTAADSIFNQPNDILWSMAGFHPYSASALAFYLSDKFKGYNFIKSWLVNTETEDDGIKSLDQTLNARDTVFTEEYIYFLASLYAKSIKSIKKYMPDVAFQTVDEVYGLGPRFGDVHLTGANFHVFNPEVGAQPGTFIATFKAGATGVPKGVLTQQKGKKMSNTPIAFYPHISGSPTAYVGGFGKQINQVVLIATDASYSAKDTALRPYEYSAIVPNIIIREVTAQSPIYSGNSSQMGIRYDLTGTFPGKPFPVSLRVVEKGPGVSDNASGEYELSPGLNHIMDLWFNTASSTHGTYKFTFQLSVPPDRWAPIPQVKTQGKCSVRVEEPPKSAMARQATAREIERPTLTIKK